MIEEKRRITEKKIQKLKDKFLIKEQSLMVDWGEKPYYFWLVEKPWRDGFTEFYWDSLGKISQIRIYICLVNKNEYIRTLLHTIAHEFAHVYLFFNNPTEYDHTKEHKKWTNYFFNFLVTNYSYKI